MRLLLKGEEARKKILKGVRALCDQVQATLGPKGRNILIEDVRGNPNVTKDGVTVANEIELEDPFENQGVKLVREAARRTNEAAGDGTTTATILATAMMEASEKHLGSGANPIAIRRGMDLALDVIRQGIKAMAVAVKTKSDYKAIATISSQSEEIGSIIADVIDEVGEDGIITIEEGSGLTIEKRLSEGMQFESGFVSGYFVNDVPRQMVVFDDAHIIVSDIRITSIHQIVPVLEALVMAQKKHIVIIAPDFSEEIIKSFVVNHMKNLMHVCAIRGPGIGQSRVEYLKDIAVVTGATLISEERSMTLEKIELQHVGFAKKVEVSSERTTIVQGWADKKREKERQANVDRRVEEVKASLKDITGEYEMEKTQQRIARMTGGVAIISVGAASEVEQRERQYRVEDALSAVRAAASEGIVPGGGTALVRIVKGQEGVSHNVSKDEANGFEIVYSACFRPFELICENAGFKAKEQMEQLLKSEDPNVGFNALTGKHEDLIKARVLDPALVTRSALENAVSVAGMFLTLEGANVRKPLDTQEQALAAMMTGGPQ